MESKLSMRTDMYELQKDYLFKKATRELGKATSETDIRVYANEYLKSFYQKAGGPLLLLRPAESGHVPFKEELEEVMAETAEDLNILYTDSENAAEFLQESFNFAQTERKRMLSRINGLNSLVGDLNLIAHENKEGNLYFKESFDSKDNAEETQVLPNVSKAQIATTEGVLTLSRTDTVNASLTATVRKVEGNGEKGTAHVARRIQIRDEKQQTTDVNVFINDNEALMNDDESVILDYRPDTIFEYQMVNVPNDFIKKYGGYNFDWVKGKETGEKLRLQLVIELAKAEDVNWININPYYPVNSTGKVRVYSIKTSEDGFDYKGLYENKGYILNNELNETAQTYRVDDLFDGKNDFDKAKFAGQGVWSFPTRKAKYIEIVFDQLASYQELIGQAVYYKTTNFINGDWLSSQIEEPKELKDSPAKKGYVLSAYQDAKIDKIIEATKGWRYAIGLRDINIMSYRFDKKSMYVSKRFEINGDISRVMLYANEKIPASYLDKIETSNDWIQYEISFDDMNWMPISPMHHEPTKVNFPPKIVEINGNEIDLGNAFQIHKAYVKTDKAPNGVRIRVTMSRPLEDGFDSTTPILEDYALRIVRKDELL